MQFDTAASLYQAAFFVIIRLLQEEQKKFEKKMKEEMKKTIYKDNVRALDNWRKENKPKYFMYIFEIYGEVITKKISQNISCLSLRYMVRLSRYGPNKGM